MTWIFCAKSDDEKRTSTYVAWYEFRVEVPIIVIVDILTPTTSSLASSLSFEYVDTGDPREFCILLHPLLIGSDVRRRLDS